MSEMNPLIFPGESPGGSPEPTGVPVRVTDYRVMPWPDGTRVTVEMGLTPFKQFPAMDISILSIDGKVVCAASLVGAIERRPAPTLHLPALPAATRLAVLIEMLEGETVTQQIIVPFEVGGPIIKRAVDVMSKPEQA
jgi:hypothetical protein